MENADKQNAKLVQALFAQPISFLKGCTEIAHLPIEGLPEIAFAGRSNVGKSSLLNALVRRRNLAHASKTPGRTREINFFTLGDQAYLVDLPGYGYAKASKAVIANWQDLIVQYLKGRAELQRVLLLIDSRHNLKDTDLAVMDLLDQAAVTYHLILTKCDKTNKQQQERWHRELPIFLRKRPAASPVFICTSAQEKTGLDALRGIIAQYLASCS